MKSSLDPLAGHRRRTFSLSLSLSLSLFLSLSLSLFSLSHFLSLSHYIYIYIYIYICVCVCMCVRACVYVCVCVIDRGSSVRLPHLSCWAPLNGRYQFGHRWHVPVAPQQRPLPTRGPVTVWCLDRWRRPPLRREKDAHHLLFFPTQLCFTRRGIGVFPDRTHYQTTVCWPGGTDFNVWNLTPNVSPVERVRLNESGWTSPVKPVQLNESGWTSPVERVRMNEFGWMSPVECVQLNESGWMSLVERVQLNKSCWTSLVEWVQLNESDWMSPVEWVRLNESGWMSPVEWWHRHWSHRLRTSTADHLSADRSDRRTYDCGSHRPRIAQTADHRRWSFPLLPSVDDHADCGSQRSADPLTVVHTVRVTHRQQITVGDHFRCFFRRRSLPPILPLMITPTGHHSVRRTHCMWIKPFA